MAEKEKQAAGKRIAVVRVKGLVGLNHQIVSTFKMLNLENKNYCTVVDATPNNIGMINKIKDYATWGEIDDETFKLLKEKRDKGEKYFALCPPRKGYGRKGIKTAFKKGGALGYRAEKINDLIKRMI